MILLSALLQLRPDLMLSQNVLSCEPVYVPTLRALPCLALGRKALLDVEVGIAFVAIPENAVSPLLFSPYVSAVWASPPAPFCAEVHVGAIARRTVGPQLDRGVYTVAPVDIFVFKAFEWRFHSAVVTKHEFSIGFHFEWRSAVCTFHRRRYHRGSPPFSPGLLQCSALWYIIANEMDRICPSRTFSLLYIEKRWSAFANQREKKLISTNCQSIVQHMAQELPWFDVDALRKRNHAIVDQMQMLFFKTLLIF